MMGSFGSLKQAIFDREARKQQYQDHIRGLNAYDRHKKFLNDYVGYYGKDKSARETLPVKTDQDTLEKDTVLMPLVTFYPKCYLNIVMGFASFHQMFIRTEEDDMNPSWEQRLVKRYYDKLFKEYCIADMSQYKTGKIGLRWRTEKEVMSGKGTDSFIFPFSSAFLSLPFMLNLLLAAQHMDSLFAVISTATRKMFCQAMRQVAAKVNFSYFEAGEHKQALVKLVAYALRSCIIKQKEKEQLKQKENEKHQRKRDRSESEDDADVDYGRSKEREKVLAIACTSRMSLGDKASTSATDHKKTYDNDENFDEFLEGMFP
ncbi:protein FRA10AC1 [Sesamum angolense]|uniref:Protein FRA10AC1 n=1 Tax=Sesamum angolense TaxID=2727404 RepID=A0AAE1T4H5_9LAMI|nr:protein FRA10AC1 [Sesamum angolense]